MTLIGALAAVTAGDIIYLDPGSIHAADDETFNVAEVRITTKSGKATIQRATSTTQATYLLQLNTNADNCVIENIIFEPVYIIRNDGSKAVRLEQLGKQVHLLVELAELRAVRGEIKEDRERQQRGDQPCGSGFSVQASEHADGAGAEHGYRQ